MKGKLESEVSQKVTKEFKQTAVHRLNSGQRVAEVARALEVHPSDLHRWRRELQSIVQMCESAGFSRAGYYRFLGPLKPAPADMDLRDEIQKIAVEWPCYGSSRITVELENRRWDVNRKRVQRLMREDNLLCVTKRKFVAPTTDSAMG